MNILTSLLSRDLISKFIPTNEGVKAFENLQRDMVNIWPQSAFIDADISNATVNYQETGLVIGMQPNSTYLVCADLTFQSANTGTGIALGIDLPAGAIISGEFHHNLTLTTQAGSYNIASGAAKAPTTGVPVANENLPLFGRWVIVNGPNQGNAVLKYRSGTGGVAVTLKAGLCEINAYQTR